MKKQKYRYQTIRRDSGTGKIISKKQAAKKDPKTWEKERVRVPINKPKKKK